MKNNNEINELLLDLGKFKDMVLATSSQDRVTARTVSTILYNKKIYFQTANDMEKYIQIIDNSSVALTKGFYQLEGIAKSIGTWSDNPEICECYKSIHSSSYNNYGMLPEEEVIEVHITRLKLWTYENNEVYLIDCDLNNDTYSKVKQAQSN